MSLLDPVWQLIYTMQINNKTQSNRPKILAGICILLALFLVVVIIYQRSAATKEQASREAIENQTETQDPRQSNTPTNTQAQTQTDILLKNNTTPETEATSQSSSDSAQTKNENTKQEPDQPKLGCSTETNQICTIKKDDQIYLVLGQNPDTELLLNGVKIKPKTITYQLTPATYNDEQMKDGAGKVLTSSLKEYDPASGILQLLIGANPDYYKSLTYSQKKLLYVSQTVRTFMAMFGETPENYVKVEQVVNSLGSWQPSP